MIHTIQNPPDPKVLHLELSREGDRLKISLTAQWPGEASTVRQVEEMVVPMQRVDQRCRRMVEMLNQANRQCRLTAEVLGQLKDTGQLFRDELFSARIKDRLNATSADHMIISLDDHLAHIPWELLHDGRGFLCEKLAVGRIVRTRQAVIAAAPSVLLPPSRVLILADPAGDLKAAYSEGVDIRDFMEQSSPGLQVTFRSGGVTSDFIQTRLRHFDWVHFAGHTDYDCAQPGLSGWRLSKERFTAERIIKMAGTGAMPALVFTNACQSARSEAPDASGHLEQHVFGLANAFIMAGVRHYVGTLWEMADDASRHFAFSFYHHLMTGLTIGQALRDARQAMIAQLGLENIAWAGYLLYGDPTATYFPKDTPKATDVATPSLAKRPAAESQEVGAGLRAPEEVIHFTSTLRPRSAKRVLRNAAIGLVLLAAVSGSLLAGSRLTHSNRYEQQALAAFTAGDYATVTRICEDLRQRRPQRTLSYLLQGNVNFFQGKLAQAEAFFNNAMDGTNGTPMEKAEALIGLGRIASVGGQSQRALEYYQRAADLAPANERPYLAQAMVLERQGDFDQALQLLEKARTLSKDPDPIEALQAQLQAKATLRVDQERRQRIDGLIAELNQLAASKPAPSEEDPWRSRPVTLWIMDIENAGYDLQEGKAILLTGALTQRMLQAQRIILVERALLDEVLTELKIGASRLSGQDLVLGLGRLVSARLILFGRLLQDGPHSQVSLRCVEVETGTVRAVINDTFEAQTTTSTMAARLAEALQTEIEKSFPLRARLIEQKGAQLILDIGQRQGMAKGIKLRRPDTPLVVEVIAVETDRCTARAPGEELLAAGTPFEALP
ncbi:MAG: CHAT domain-containing protein [Desulfatitalea sp.]